MLSSLARLTDGVAWCYITTPLCFCAPMLLAFFQSLPEVLTALASLIAALVSGYVAVKQAKADTKLNTLTDAHNASHPENPVQ